MKRIFALLLIVTSTLVIPHAAQARSSSTKGSKPFPVTIVDDLGNRIRIPAQPKRIISLDPRDTETLFALGLEKRLVADGTHYAEGAEGIDNSAGKARSFRYPSEWPSRLGRDYPVRAPALPHIEGGCCGTPFDLEKIESLQPDLIFSLNSDQADVQKMRDLGLKVIVLDPANFNGVLHDIKLTGKATGTPAQANAVVDTMKKQLASVEQRLKNVRTHPLVYYEVDASNPTEPYTAGPHSFIDQGILLSGGKNAAESVKTCSGKDCYPQVTLEALVKLDPQIILLGDAAYGVKPDDVKARSGWETISAVKSGKIYPFDDELISRAGPRISIGVRTMAKLIHPEAFKK